MDKIDDEEACFYDDMREVMNNPRLSLNILDKQQMFEVVDK
jgi:hypothetical protein